MAVGRPLLVLVTGPPASGKTTIAAQVARQLGIPAFHKDDFKERLADEIAGSGLEWSQSLGRAAYELIFHIGQVLIEAGDSCLLEANFHPVLSLPGLMPLAGRSDVAQIVCAGHPETLMDRYFSRHGTGVRHPVHLDVDPARRDRLAASFRRDHRLDLDGLTIDCDTTADEPVDANDLVEQIREWIESGA